MSADSVREAIAAIRSAAETERHVGNGASMEEIDSAITRLGVVFPTDFSAFLAEFGHGGVGGLSIMGINVSGEPSMDPGLVEHNLAVRSSGLPRTVLLIEEVGDGSYFALDLAQGSDHGRVVVWPLDGRDVDDLEEVASNYGEFLLLRAKDALDVGAEWH